MAMANAKQQWARQCASPNDFLSRADGTITKCVDGWQVLDLNRLPKP